MHLANPSALGWTLVGAAGSDLAGPLRATVFEAGVVVRPVRTAVVVVEDPPHPVTSTAVTTVARISSGVRRDCIRRFRSRRFGIWSPSGVIRVCASLLRRRRFPQGFLRSARGSRGR